MVGIYKITSPSGKSYIGQGTDIERRWKREYTKLYCKGQPKLYNSIKKYGFDSFQKEILEECSIEQLNEREVYYKKLELDKVGWDWDKVLFCELYDRFSGPRSEETKLKISKARKGKKRNPHTKQGKENIRQSLLGRKVSDETKLKMRLSRLGKKDSIETIEKRKKSSIGKIRSIETINKIKLSRILKPIKQLNLNKELIKEFKSINEASKELNIAASLLVINLKGRSKTCKGFIFKYK